MIEQRHGVPHAKGPDDLQDLPVFFGQEGGAPDDVAMTCASSPRSTTCRPCPSRRSWPSPTITAPSGADVIDLGCSMDRPFSAAGEVIRTLKERGFTVSIDTFNTEEILAADAAGVDYLLSLNGSNMDLAPRLHCIPVIIPDFGQGLDSLYANIDAAEQAGIR